MKYLDPRYIRSRNKRMFDERKRYIDINLPSLSESEKVICIAYYYFSISLNKLAQMYKIRPCALYRFINSLKAREVRVLPVSPAEAEWRFDEERY